MDKRYEIDFLFAESQQERAETLHDALQDALPGLIGDEFRDDCFEFNTNRFPPHQAGQDSVVRLVIFLAEPDTLNPQVAAKVDDWNHIGVLTVPILHELDDGIDQVVPESIRHINAFPWTQNESPAPRMVLDLLRLLGFGVDERQVFISYKRADSQQVANSLFDALTERSFKVFLDCVSIEKGEDFQAALMKELSQFAMVILLESPNVTESSWVREEIQFARRHKLGLLAVTWPELRKDPEKCMREIPPGYRIFIECIDAEGRLPADELNTILQEIESVHAIAMARRRKELLGSVMRFAEQHNLKWHRAGPAALLIESGNRRELVMCKVVPRIAKGEDLFQSEEDRKNQKVSSASVIYPGFRLETHDDDYLQWVANGNDVLPVMDLHVNALMKELAQW